MHAAGDAARRIHVGAQSWKVALTHRLRQRAATDERGEGVISMAIAVSAVT